jgi:hypothetical protein
LVWGLASGLIFAASVAVTQSEDLILELHADKARFYAGERVAFSVRLLVGAAQVRDVRYPRLKAAGVSVTEFAEPRRGAEQRGDHDYQTYEFRSAFSSARAGTHVLGPAELECEMLQPASGAAAVFGGSQSRTVKVYAEPIVLQAVSPPAKGRPADYAGAIGRFSVVRRVLPAVGAVGMPIAVTTRIEAASNIGALACESIDLVNVRSYAPRSTSKGSLLTCEQILIPEVAGRLAIRAASVSFFDPDRGRYRVVRSGPFEVVVLPTDVPPIAPTSSPMLASSPESVEPKWPSLAWAGAGLLLAIALLAMIARQRSNWRGARGENSAVAARPAAVADWLKQVEQGLAAHDVAAFYLAVFRALQTNLATRSGLRAAAITGKAAAGALVRDGTDQRWLAEHGVLLALCDRVRYGMEPADAGEMADTLHRLRELLQLPPGR